MLLNIIFEVEARISNGMPTLFIIDDIADSFDYKNKYAIVEYLSDILSQENFRQIILTHNYDFYRTVWHRLDLGGANFHISKSAGDISLTREKMYRDPFQKWKSLASGDEKTDVLIAMIPFVRNLAEYCEYSEEYKSLTGLLHIKPGFPELRVKDLLEVYSKVLNGQDFSNDIEEDQPVIPLILKTAGLIADDAESALDLEKKVVLSIAIRLNAERYMINEIDDLDWVKTIQKNQTARLIKRFKEISNGKKESAEYIELMDRVNLMTPENIHLNSFMYEPILDMSSEHLCSLYKELVEVTKSIKTI